ncbi:hypothetical protein COCHEDRAFT_1023396, partial [Bipolaris maydis C5]
MCYAPLPILQGFRSQRWTCSYDYCCFFFFSGFPNTPRLRCHSRWDLRLLTGFSCTLHGH